MQTITANIDYKILYEELLLKFNGLSEKYTTATDELQFKIESLQQQLNALKKLIFGSKHERFVPTDEAKINPQLTLELNAETIAACKITEATKVEYIRTKTQVTENKKASRTCGKVA